MDQQQPACRKSHLPPEAWYPTGMKLTEDNRLAFIVCGRCPLAAKCAQVVIDSRKGPYPIQTGIWAGVRLDRKNMEAKYKELEKKAGSKVRS